MKRLSAPVAGLVMAGAAVAFVVGPALHGQGNAVPAVPQEPTSYRALVKQVLPAVVSITSRAKPVKAQANPRRKGRQQIPDDLRKQIPPELRPFFDDLPFGQMPDNPVPREGFGSGFLVDPAGVVLTNNHVVDGADEVTVELQDGRKFVSRDIKTDPRTDLAIVRLHAKETKAFPYLQLGDSEKMEIGDRVLAVGAPFGLTGSVTHGIVSGKGRAGFNMNMYEDFIQTDAAINPGNSGGPLINLEGKVVGINSAIKSRSGGFQGVGLAIASNLARNVINALIKEGVVHRGYLGVAIADLSEDVAQHLGLQSKEGVVVGKVTEGSPAGKAGVQAGDIITSINGHPVKNGRVLQTTVAGLALHKAVPLTVVRDGKTKNLSVTIEEQPKTFGLAREEEPTAPRRSVDSIRVPKVGLELADLTPELREELGIKGQARGAVITRVNPDRVAWKAGLRQGLVVTKVNNRRVESAAAARDALTQGSLEKGILLQVQSPDGVSRYVVLQQRGEDSTGE